VQINELQIFDRWGTLVFQNQDFAPNDESLGWDGNFQGQPLNAAVYVYQASVLFSDGETVTFKGDVLLLR
jgi:gliding motility-associated-like protein